MANIHYIYRTHLEHRFGSELEDEYVDETRDKGHFDLFHDYIQTYCPTICHGDVVLVGRNKGRNGNLYFWHTTKGLLAADRDRCEIGTVPCEFLVGNGKDEFAPGHWIDAIEFYDGTIWLSESLQWDILTNLIEIEEDVYRSTVNVRGEEIVVESDTVDPEYFTVESPHFIRAT
jgi:hypothetical protein